MLIKGTHLNLNLEHLGLKSPELIILVRSDLFNGVSVAFHLPIDYEVNLTLDLS